MLQRVLLKRDRDGYLKPWSSNLVMCLTIIVVVGVLLLLFAGFIWFLPDDPSYPIQVGAAVAAPLLINTPIR
ncbi:MAG: hypothetical protein Q7S64_01390 [bacterium]|nr:hypothetical protein [bacterium]